MKNRELVTLQNPFTLMRRVGDEMERVFDEFGFRRPLGFFTKPEVKAFEWTPAIELYEKDKNFYIRAELPGLTKKDVKIDVLNDVLTLQGERKYEKEDKEEGYFRSERFYGNFYRQILLPEGVKPDLAKATFKDGVLEIEMPLEVKKPIEARRLEIEEVAGKEKAVVEKEKKELVGA
jgi:HSP20 family protein